MSTIGEVFRERVAFFLAGRSDYWLAKESGVSSSAISRVFSGKSDPSLSSIAAIARALGVTEADLLSPDKEGGLPADLISMLEGLNEPFLQSVRGVVTAFHKQEQKIRAQGGAFGQPTAADSKESGPIGREF
jgi:transcriptional regulator with XRE-family HTH domain